MLLGDQEEVNRRLGRHIVEGQYFIILVDLLAGNFTIDNFAKNTVAHTHTPPFF
jgi:hypothetical protein